MNSPVAIEKIAGELKKKGVRPSYQRVRVLEYLHQHTSHPTAEEIFEALSPEIPTLSRTTIYNTLHTFASHGLVNCLSIDGVEIRYDGMLESHGHFKCSECGYIFNFQADPESIPTPGLEGFRIEHRNIVFSGICPDCIQKTFQKKGE